MIYKWTCTSCLIGRSQWRVSWFWGWSTEGNGLHAGSSHVPTAACSQPDCDLQHTQIHQHTSERVFRWVRGEISEFLTLPAVLGEVGVIAVLMSVSDGVWGGRIRVEDRIHTLSAFTKWPLLCHRIGWNEVHWGKKERTMRVIKHKHTLFPASSVLTS